MEKNNRDQQDQKLAEDIVKPLCDWFLKGHRQMYWRTHPQPYYVWVSEIMLQQTRVEAVRGYFDRFIQELPNLESLAHVDEDRLMKLWEGLGYYNRARNMKKAAMIVVEEYGGKMPAEYEQLLSLPGIGEYTAGAIASIAFGKPEPCVDGNVLRVWMRLVGSDEDILKASVKKKLRQILKPAMPMDCPGTFNQALMELGACVCLPSGLPKCKECPLQELCAAKKTGIETDLELARSIPYRAKNKPRKQEELTVLVCSCRGRIAVNRRSDTGLLAGMWEFPNISGKLSLEDVRMLFLEAGLIVQSVKSLGGAKHIFSHIEWHMEGYFVELPDSLESGNFVKEEDSPYGGQVRPIITEMLGRCRFETPDDLWESYSLPSAFQAYTMYLKGKE